MLGPLYPFLFIALYQCCVSKQKKFCLISSFFCPPFVCLLLFSFCLPILSHTHIQMLDSCLLFLPSKNAFFSLWRYLTRVCACGCVCVEGEREWTSAKPSSLPECRCKDSGWQRGLRVSSPRLSIMSKTDRQDNIVHLKRHIHSKHTYWNLRKQL